MKALFFALIKPCDWKTLSFDKSTHMKKYILIAAVACASMVTSAQSAETTTRPKKELKSPEERAQNQTKRMTERYGLDPLQSERLLEVNRARIAQQEASRAQENAVREERKAQRTARKAAQDRYVNEVRAVMNAEQFASFEKDMEERHKNRLEKRAAKKASKKE